MFQYQKNDQYFAQVAGGMEELCAEELVELGARNLKKAYRGQYFIADRAALYRINYSARLCVRILAPLATFSCHHPKCLADTSRAFEWKHFLSPDKTFAISASVSDSAITHSLYAAQCMKDGIADYFNGKYGRRPNVDTVNPDVRFNLHIERNKAVFSLDTSGESLHKRGYRRASVLAPMQEVLAAALVRISGWDGSRPLWDCMCGSGTILCEALMRYCRIPAQYRRKNFGFFALPDFDSDLWKRIRVECDGAVRPLPRGIIRGSDVSAQAVAAARRNIECIPGHENVEIANGDFRKSGPFEQGIIICNPPYGVRIGSAGEVQALYKELGNFLKKYCNGTSAYIYVGDDALGKHIGLKPARRIHLPNGPLKAVVLRIDSYRVAFRETAGA